MAADPYWRPPEELKEIASQILTEKTLIRMLYLWLQDAAVKATKNESVKENSRNICTYPIGTLATSRLDTCSEIVQERYRILYHPEDILIVGGVAIALYDEAISGIKISKYQNTSTLRGYLQKDTSDIDMVWWPRIEDNTPDMEEHVITINSPAISQLVSAYVRELNTIFENKEAIPLINKAIHIIRPDIRLVRIEVEESTKGIRAGVKKVLIHFIITVPEINQKEIKLEICDISIHDGASSQMEFDSESKNPILKSMIVDPVYCHPESQIVAFPLLHSKKIHVPHIMSILDQQLLAFKNLLYAGNDKCIINYKRIRYLQLMIFNYVYQKHNANIGSIFKIPVDIINLLNGIDGNLDDMISEVCSRRNNRSQLCHKLQQLYTMYQHQLQSFIRIHQQQQQLHELVKWQQGQQLQQLQQSQLSPQKVKPQSLSKITHEPLRTIIQKPVNKTKLPDFIEYVVGKHKILFNLKDKPDVKLEIEQSPVLTYYHLLEPIEKNSDGKEQFKRIKIIIHDMFDNKNKEKIQKQIDIEAKHNPLKSLLLKQGGGYILRNKQTRRNQTRRKQTRRNQTRRKQTRRKQLHRRTKT